MNDIEKRAHDLAVAFITYDIQKNNDINAPEDFANLSHEAYERIFKWLTDHRE